MCGGSIDFQMPSFKYTEDNPMKLLMELQTEIATEQWERQKELEPFLLEQMGYTRDPETGELMLDPMLAEITDLQRERQLAALKGELPVDPALERGFREEEATLGETMSRKLGPNWQQTTPGQQAMSRMQERHAALEHSARTGMMSTAQGLALQQMGANIGNIQNVGAGAAQTSGLMGMAMQPYQNLQQMGMNLGMAQMQAGAQRQAGLMGMAGTLVGGLGGGLLGNPGLFGSGG